MTGLDALLGFLHEDKAATTPLVYDFQEPYRWLVDYTVLRMVLSRTFSWDDFYFTGDDYRLRIKPPLLDRYTELLREHFNSGTLDGGKRLAWDTVVFRKCQELARYLLGEAASLDFTSPRPVLKRSDTRMLQERLLSLSQSQAHKLGIGKSTLHHLRQNAESYRSFRV